MNIYQRIVLVLGAIALVVGLWTVPSIVRYDGRNMPIEEVRIARAEDKLWYLFAEMDLAQGRKRKDFNSQEEQLKYERMLRTKLDGGDFAASRPLGKPFRSVGEIILRALIVLGTTTLLCIVMKDIEELFKNKPEKQSYIDSDGNEQNKKPSIIERISIKSYTTAVKKTLSNIYHASLIRKGDGIAKFKNREKYNKWKLDKIKERETGKEILNSRQVLMAEVLRVKRWIQNVWHLMNKKEE
jgi:hypothetical protein